MILAPSVITMGLCHIHQTICFMLAFLLLLMKTNELTVASKVVNATLAYKVPHRAGLLVNALFISRRH